MIRGKRLTDEISVSELETMRESGMTNAQIAKNLDVSVHTVMRYIGKMPQEMRRKQAKGKLIEIQTSANQTPVLAVRSMTFEMDGKLVHFRANLDTGSLEMSGDALVGIIPARQVEDLIRDLQLALNTTKSVKGFLDH